MAKSIWGIDLGGTKIEGVVLDASDPAREICRPRVPTEADLGYDHILGQIVKLVAKLEEESGETRPPLIGIGTPGSLSPRTGRLRGSNAVAMNGQCLKKDLEEKLGVELRMENDANCFALAEARLGAGREVAVVFGVILGTGVGGGIAVRGRTWNGHHSIAGEWGHNILEPDGQQCYCGRRGCVETVLSGKWLEREFETRTGRSLTLPQIVEAAPNDHAAAQTVDRLVKGFARGIATVVNILDPDLVTIGGGVGNVDALYGGDMHKELARWVFSDYCDVRVVKPELGDSAGALGAALLADEARADR